ncbi:Na/Pi cotransporter family protein [Nitrosophilus alvini]|uniref:Na/Pi cotransporter family protein n=1 Tax=Nitrosophilus alvini TaxID=2714855 RepID=UPI00190D5B97|nr:Na/Pi symporter [Nitrosophilus alvini]
MTNSIVTAVSGLGIFLFAVFYLEEGLRELAGRSFKKFIRSFTDTLPKSIFTGFAATAILQSSSLVSLIVLSFVGAGFMSLKSAIGVIFGANIGTTVTAWLVALFGFKIDIASFALPMAGAGGFLLIFFSDKRKTAAFAKVLIGLGVLFLGLGFMKESMQTLAENIDLKDYIHYGNYIFLLIGFVVTALIQSSSATTAIALTALYSGIITFEMAASLVIGANVGTTVTALLGSIGGTADKKRVAAAHFIFNAVTGIIAYAILGKMGYFILEVLGLKNDLVIALALFHTIFNVLGVLVFAPFASLLAVMLGKMFTKRESPVTKYIDKVPPDIPEAALEALKNESLHLFKNVLEFGLFLLNIRPADVLIHKKHTKEVLESNRNILDIDYYKLYKNLKKLEIKIFSYANMVKAKELASDEVEKLNKIVLAVEKTMLAAKTLKDIKYDIDEFAMSLNEYEYEVYIQFRKRIIRLFRNFIRVLEGEAEKEYKIRKIYQSIARDNETTLHTIAQNIKLYSLSETDAATILNANRAIYLSSKALIEAAEQLFMSISAKEIEE